MTDDKLLMNGANGAAPAYMAGVGDDNEFGEGMDGGSFPRLAFKGSRFRLRQGDEEIVMKETSIEVIILKDYPAISRIFFGSAYDPDGQGKPTCASADGEFPLSNITSPQGKNCATCPQNEKGSVITDDGKKSRACSFYKRLVILIKGYEEVGPIVSDIKAMSLFGDSQTGENLWSLKAYFARLKSNGVMPFHLWTEMTFDTEESVPKVLFRPVGYVDEAVFTTDVTPLIATPDGKLQLELFADTSKVQIEGADDEPAKSGFRDKLLEGDKPKHLTDQTESVTQKTVAAANVVEKAEQPKVVASLETQLAAAVASSNFTLAAELQAEITKRDAEAEIPKVDLQGVVDNMKVDLKLAIEASDYGEAAKIQEQMTNFMQEHMSPEAKRGATIPAKPANDGELTPAQKGAATRKRNAELKKAAAEAAAAAEPQVEDKKVEQSEGFGDELEGALKDFGF